MNAKVVVENHHSDVVADEDDSVSVKKAPLITKMFQASDDLSLTVVASKLGKNRVTAPSASGP
jgi:hypothetical protein